LIIVKDLIEILKELRAILFAGLFGLIGAFLVNVIINIPLFDKEGHIAWLLIIVAIALAVIGHYIYKLGEKIIEK